MEFQLGIGSSDRCGGGVELGVERACLVLLWCQCRWLVVELVVQFGVPNLVCDCAWIVGCRIVLRSSRHEFQLCDEFVE